MQRSGARETGGLNDVSGTVTGQSQAAAVSPESDSGANERTPTVGGVTRLNDDAIAQSPAGVVPAGIRVGTRARSDEVMGG